MNENIKILLGVLISNILFWGGCVLTLLSFKYEDKIQVIGNYNFFIIGIIAISLSIIFNMTCFMIGYINYSKSSLKILLK